MISRREFIKLFGVGVVGITSGITATQLNSKAKHEFICGFIPDDKNILALINDYIKQKTDRYTKIVLKRVEQSGIRSNIITGDDNSNIYSLSNLNNYLFSLRNKIVDKEAKYYFEADLSESKLSNLLFPKEQKIVIKNYKGIFEIVDQNKNYNLIEVPGEQGITEIKISNNLVNVLNSPCRHKLCMKQNYLNSAICVPNKITVQKTFV